MENNLIERELLKKIISWIDEKEIFVVLGPRQAGKTTLFKIIHNYLRTKKEVPNKNIFYCSFEDPELRTEFNKDPKEFVESRIGKKQKYYFFFDEYHWVNEGGQKLKLLFDIYPQIKFFVTGSSSLELTFKTGRYLVGRAFFFYLYPLSFAEFLKFKDEFVYKSYLERKENLYNFILKGKQPGLGASIYENKLSKFFAEYCLYGGYPEVVKKPSLELKIEVLKNINATYLERDVRSLLLISDLDSYQTLVKLLAAQTGQMINCQQLSSDSGMYFKLIKKYLTILEETFVIKRVRPFFKNLGSELRKNPKIFFYDLGLRNFLIGNFSPLASRPDRGGLVESAIFSNLTFNLSQEKKINFWRTKAGAEVDFIINLGNEVVPVETKFSKLKKPVLSRGFRNFLSVYKPKRAVVLTKSEGSKIRVNNTEVVFCPVWYV